MSHFFQKKKRNNTRRIIANNSTTISIIRLELTGRFAILQVIPNTRRILNILLPTMFPMAMSDCFLKEATTEVTSSGAEVPKATTVRPITASLTQNQRAILFADPTRSSAHIPRPISHPITYNIDDGIDLSMISSLISSFFSSSVFHHLARVNV